jgi:PAS domain-containing protein
MPVSAAEEDPIGSSAIAGRHGRALLDAMSDLVFVVGTDGVYRAVKAESETELAAPPDRLVGSSVDDVLPSDVAQRIMACARQARERDSVEAIDYELDLGKGPRSFEGRVAASSEDEFVLLVRDVTDERRRAAELNQLTTELEARVSELGRERDFTRALVRAVPIFLVLVDDAGGLLGLNDSAEAETGLVSDEQVGRPFWDVLVSAKARDGGRALIGAVRAGERPAQPELELSCGAASAVSSSGPAPRSPINSGSRG